MRKNGGMSSAPQHTDDPWQDLLNVMDRLVAADGCDWCGEQTHESLVKFLLEETHELAEAIETEDAAGVREELGDVLLQVVFHARLAADSAEDGFTANDVVRDLIAKMVRRHPHVFADQEVDGDLYTQWDEIKRAEKQRESVLDGIPETLGALARAQKVLSRAQRAGLLPDGSGAKHSAGTDELTSAAAGEQPGNAPSSADFGAELLRIVQQAQEAGIDAEGALRAATRELGADLRAEEQREQPTARH